MKRLRRALSARLKNWAKRRQGIDPPELTLTGRRIYILPTGQGLAFGLMMFVMLLGGMNYNNSLGLAVTFLLAGLGLVVMHHCHRSLAGLVVRSHGAEPVFTGQNARFRVTLENPSRHRRIDVAVFFDGGLAGCVDLEPGAQAEVDIPVPAEHRGVLELDRFSLRCRYPAALFQSWAWVHCSLKCIVYPRPADDVPEPPRAVNDSGTDRDDRQGDGDFAGLREYRHGDSPRHIAWKTFARNDELRIKTFAGTDDTPPQFDYAATRGGTEQRLSELCRWILDADRAGQAFGLTLPSQKVAPAGDAAHVRECLTALAKF